MIVEYDNEFNFLRQRPVEFPFKSSNKGFEAVAHVRRGDTDYLLALCEGNKCKCGKEGRKPGRGRVQLFEKKRKSWKHVRAVALRIISHLSIIRACPSTMAAWQSPRGRTQCFGSAISKKYGGRGAMKANSTSFHDLTTGPSDTVISKELAGSVRLAW